MFGVEIQFARHTELRRIMVLLKAILGKKGRRIKYVITEERQLFMKYLHETSVTPSNVRRMILAIALRQNLRSSSRAKVRFWKNMIDPELGYHAIQDYKDDLKEYKSPVAEEEDRF
jgi:hypothetical protein